MTTPSSVKCPECGNDLWDVSYLEPVAKCSNCRYERPYHRRSVNVTGTPKPSQQKAIDRIVHYFKDYRDWKSVDGKIVDIYPGEYKHINFTDLKLNLLIMVLFGCTRKM